MWRDNSIGFDNSRCIWKFVVYRVQYYIHFATGLMLKPKYDSYPGLADATSERPVSRFTDESKFFEIIFLCRSVR